MANKLAELSIGYPVSPLTAPDKHWHDGPAPGGRAPILQTANPVGSGATPCFALFAQADPEGAQLIARHRDLLESTIRAPFAENGIWLVRPDGYVAMVAGRGGWADVDTYLRRILAGATGDPA